MPIDKQEDSNGEGNSGSHLPDLPKDLSNLTGWWKVSEIVSYVLMFLSPVAVGFAQWLPGWLPGILSDRYVSLLLGFLALLAAFFIRWLGTPSARTAEAAKEIRRASRPFSKAERDGLASYLESLDRRHRCWVFAAGATFVGLVASIGLAPLLHHVRTDIPAEITFHEARYFDPTQDKVVIEKAPFLNAIRTSLAAEGNGEGQRYKIVLFETHPFPHPTKPFQLTLQSVEPGWFEVTGYVFRVRDGREVRAYEPVPADQSVDDILTLSIPASEPGDRVFGILRVTLKDHRPFPTKLNQQIKATTPRTTSTGAK
ncbi:hypothetical protein [Urbifossiella limnaea]|uniref:Uncharacterized protein n=1 Tax=Urbifossiella limnaea TaxID=2528023 RepID=A0A517XPC7_9BACT|nr:hypothetical protein [Urbifossiella limnaea]QDU19355.1 hypothetical protein ETAA1_12620 [Urbifossiella limnaea]